MNTSPKWVRFFDLEGARRNDLTLILYIKKCLIHLGPPGREALMLVRLKEAMTFAWPFLTANPFPGSLLAGKSELSQKSWPSRLDASIIVLIRRIV